MSPAARRCRRDVTEQLGHEGLAEAHDLHVGLTLGVEVGATLAAAHGQGGEGILKDLLKAQELDDGEVYVVAEPKAALVGPMAELYCTR